MIVDQARYHDGHRLPCIDLPRELGEIRAGDSMDFVWVGMKDPSDEAFESVAHALDLHALAVEDSVSGDQRPKVERYGDGYFFVLRPLRYIDETSDVESGELMVFLGRDYVVTVRRGDAVPLMDLRTRLEEDPHALLRGPWGVMHAVLDHVVDRYLEIEDELQVDLEEIERRVFSDDGRIGSEGIYELKREVLEFKRAAAPLIRPLFLLTGEDSPVPTEELRLLFRDVKDHLAHVVDNNESQDRLLTDALSAHLAQVGVRQNQDTRKISAWAAMAALPTMIAGVYGMNFTGMPELDASVRIGGREVYYGYPIAMLLMVGACVLLYRLFKRSGWL